MNKFKYEKELFVVTGCLSWKQVSSRVTQMSGICYQG